MKHQSTIIENVDINTRGTVCEHLAPRFKRLWLEQIETAVTRFFDVKYRQRGVTIFVAERDMRTADGEADSYAVEVHSGSPNQDLEAGDELKELVDSSYVVTSEMAEFDGDCPICVDATRGGWRRVFKAIVIPPRTETRPKTHSG